MIIPSRATAVIIAYAVERGARVERLLRFLAIVYRRTEGLERFLRVAKVRA
jgi:hypothetical protein